MLQSVQDLKGFKIQAVDGEIGRVEELYFDEDDWTVRYLVVNIGMWLFGRFVLIVPAAVEEIDPAGKQLKLDLTKQQIEESPDIVTDEPISREKERLLHNHFHWRPYWSTSPYDALAFRPSPIPAVRPDVRSVPDEQQEEDPQRMETF